MLTWIARRLRGQDRQSGISLVELLVTIMIFSLIMVMVSGFFMGASKTIDLSRGLTVNTKAASNAMNAVTRAVRAGTNNPVEGSSVPAPAFVLAKSDDIAFYAYVNLSGSVEQPVMYRFWVDRTTGTLFEAQWPASSLGNGRWSFPALTSTPTYTRVIAETIAPAEAGAPPFAFMLTGVADAVTAPAGGLTLANRQKIAGLKVVLSVQSTLTDADKLVTLQNLVGMPNLGYGKKSTT